jgi:GntR family transcriptional regulator / MocR family aminotransferase
MARSGRFQDFPLDPRARGTPVHRWLYDQLRRAILEGRLRPGARLPSTRELSRQQAIARATVVNAFEQLQAEGYITSRMGSGTVVASELPDRFLSSGNAAAAKLPGASLAKPSMRGQAFASRTPRCDAPSRAFAICIPATDGFPLDTWAQLTARRLRLSRNALLARGDPRGSRPLRAAVANYLKSARSVRCDADQVVIVSGTQQAFDFIGRITLDPGDPVWMENPGYPGAVRGFEAAGARIIPVPIDGHGLDVQAGLRREPSPKLVYVTPAHQFPLGVTMPLERRLSLLQLAAQKGFWIFEDDYDGEYRYDVRPIGSLQGQDRGENVIYVGTFNKMMFSALRLGYVVLPPALIEPFLGLRDAADRCLPNLEQAVLADFIQEGHFERHVRRSRARYLERRDILLDAAQRHLRGLLDLESTAAGFQLVGTLSRDFLDTEAQARAAAHDVDVTALSWSYLGPGRPPRDKLLLGFAAISPRAIRSGVERLAKALADR